MFSLPVAEKTEPRTWFKSRLCGSVNKETQQSQRLPVTEQQLPRPAGGLCLSTVRHVERWTQAAWLGGREHVKGMRLCVSSRLPGAAPPFCHVPHVEGLVGLSYCHESSNLSLFCQCFVFALTWSPFFLSFLNTSLLILQSLQKNAIMRSHNSMHNQPKRIFSNTLHFRRINFRFPCKICGACMIS